LSANKHIALITVWFPPQKSVATNRMLAFAEYLGLENKIDVFTLNQEEKSVEWNKNVSVHYRASSAIFEFLKDHQADGSLVHKLKVATRLLLSKIVQNPLSKWQQKTLSKLKEIHLNQPFDCIISSFSPQEAHLVAIEFKKEFPDVKWIADMRDEMSANPYIDVTTKNTLRKVEQKVNDYADAVTSVSLPILFDFKELLPKVKIFEEIRNGFNHDFKRNTTDLSSKNEVFTLGYFGTFYGKRKPGIVLEALKQLLNEQAFDFELQIIGAHENFSIPSEIASKVKTLPPLDYLKAIEKMAQFDGNIQIHPKSEQKGVFTGKLFDYISVQKPILAFVDKEDVAAQLIEEFNCGYVAEFSDLEETKQIIREAYNDWQDNKIKFATNEQVQSLHRKKQVKKLTELITSLTK
jgi:glycosyltransferase involved in cell wall biosynthesis